MVGTCSICLGTLDSPVSIPCGHVHCEKCLTTYVNSGTSAIKSTCPSCRAPFHLVAPDLAYLPKKYHAFVLPSLRRIFFDAAPAPAEAADTAELRARVAQLEAHARTLEAQQETLLRECERHMGNARVHATRERAARADVDALRAELHELAGDVSAREEAEERVAELEERAERAEDAADAAQRELRAVRAQAEALQVKYGRMKTRYLDLAHEKGADSSVKRKAQSDLSVDASADLSRRSSDAREQEPPARVTRPLPRSRRAPTSEAGAGPPPVFRKRVRISDEAVR